MKLDRWIEVIQSRLSNFGQYNCILRVGLLQLAVQPVTSSNYIGHYVNSASFNSKLNLLLTPIGNKYKNRIKVYFIIIIVIDEFQIVTFISEQCLFCLTEHFYVGQTI